MAKKKRWGRSPWKPLTAVVLILAGLYTLLGLTGNLTPRLGLDLEGGTSVILTARAEEGQNVEDASVAQAVEIIRQRVNSLGVAEAQVVQQGEQVVVSVPGRGRDEVVGLVGQTAELRFREVICADQAIDTSGTQTTSCSDALGSGTATQSPDPALLLSYAAETCQESTVADTAGEQLVTCSADGTTKYLLAPAEVVGTDVDTATSGIGANSQGMSTGEWQVNIDFTGEGQDKWTDLTSRTVGGRIAIVLDGLVQSAPTIQQTITGPAQITGGFTQEAAEGLADVLRYGSLPLAFDQSQAQSVSATLGGDSLRAGLGAGLLGLVLIILYCLAYYRLLGVVTVAALGVAGGLVYAMVCLLGAEIGFTLTLAGIAGLIVSIGITADSFVVFFERIKDEYDEGRRGRSAVSRAWVRARRTIISANTVSLLAAVVLYVVSIGDVRGFAFTLGLSTLIDLVVVFFFTKPLVELVARRKMFNQPALSGLGGSRIGRTRTTQTGVSQ